MKVVLLAGLLSLEGIACGSPSTSTSTLTSFVKSTNSQIPQIQQATEAYFAFDGLEPGELSFVPVYEGEETKVQQACDQTELICGCFDWRAILIDQTCDFCQTLSHEFGHETSWLLHHDPDMNHQRYGVLDPQNGTYIYRFPFSLCVSLKERSST